MSTNQRLSLAGLAAVVLVVAFVLARSGGSDDTKTATPKSGVVVVRNARPVGGVQRLTFKKGGTIDFTVRSDTADEVHFHGYDIGKDVEAGGSVHFHVPARYDGRFEVELEKRKQQIAEVEVQP